MISFDNSSWISLTEVNDSIWAGISISWNNHIGLRIISRSERRVFDPSHYLVGKVQLLSLLYWYTHISSTEGASLNVKKTRKLFICICNRKSIRNTVKEEFFAMILHYYYCTCFDSGICWKILHIKILAIGNSQSNTSVSPGAIVNLPIQLNVIYYWYTIYYLGHVLFLLV